MGKIVKKIYDDLMKEIADLCAKWVIEKVFCQVCKVPLLTESWNVFLDNGDISGQPLCCHCAYWFARETGEAKGYNTTPVYNRKSRPFHLRKEEIFVF